VSIWISPDPIIGVYLKGLLNNGIYDPRNLSMFTYSYNNPVLLLERNGMAPSIFHPFIESMMEGKPQAKID